MRISNLTDPIDIYSEWIDKSDQVNGVPFEGDPSLGGFAGGADEADDYGDDD